MNAVPNVANLVHELAAIGKEESWFEFKHNWFIADMLGHYISGLSNAATLAGREYGYLIWGVKDDSHEIVGTNFDPSSLKGKGNEDVEPWLRRLIQPDVDFQFVVADDAGKKIVVLLVPAAHSSPTAFERRRYIRLGSYLKPLDEFPELEAKLFEVLRRKPYEDRIAKGGLGASQVLQFLDFTAFFRLTGEQITSNESDVLTALSRHGLIRKADDGGWSITNLGALLIAHDLSQFPTLSYKALRIIQYQGRNKAAGRREFPIPAQGYASSFESILNLLRGVLPMNEVIQRDLRVEVSMYPELALREILANALVHQDFTISGAGPMVEIFEDRIVIRNPGNPLVPPDRFLDQDQARNERLVSVMRRMGIVEQSGSGIDKTMEAIEGRQLPALQIRTGSVDPGEVAETVVTIYGHKAFGQMKLDERILAAYWHAAFQWIQNETMSNASLRNRFGLGEESASGISLLIKKALEEGRIRAEDEGVGNRARRYLPWWA